MPVIRYGKTGLLGQVTPTYTPTYTPPTPAPYYTPTYTPPTPAPYYTPTYTPPTPAPYYTPTYTPPTPAPYYTPTYTPPAPAPYYTPPYQGTPSYVPPPMGIPTEINPEEAGLQPEGSIPPQLVYGGGGAFGPSPPLEEEMAEEIPEEPKKTNWLLWILLAVGAYTLFGGETL